MIWLVLAAAVLMLCFVGVMFFGAPYLPTLGAQIETAFELADMKPGDTLIELGCGDGRVLLAAARRGQQAVGYELNPLLAAIAWLRTRSYRSQVRVVWGDFWRAEWPPATTIFTFLLTKYMPKLDKKIMQYPHKPVKLVSYAFEIPGKKPAAKKSAVFLYRY